MNLRDVSYDAWKKEWPIAGSHKHIKLRIFVYAPSGVPIRALLLGGGTAIGGQGKADAVLFISFQNRVLTTNCIDFEDFEMRSKLNIYSLS